MNATDPAIQRDTDVNYQLLAANDQRDQLAALDQVLPRVSVRTVVENANRTATADPNPMSDLASEIHWNDDDNGAWWTPQGISGSADALGEGTYLGHNIVLVTWYDKEHEDDDGKTVNRGARVSFVDVSDRNRPVYRHVLLVKPATPSSGSSAADFDGFTDLHAGGCVWYGHLLYVAGTDHIAVFDLDHLWEVEVDPDHHSTTVGLSDGKYYARDYKYVLPQAFEYHPGGTQIRCSFLSLDRTTTPDSIVVGEWDSKEDAHLARWDISFRTRELRYDDSGGKTATAREGYSTSNILSMQGAVSVKGTLYVDCTHSTDPGLLYQAVPDGSPATKRGFHTLAGPEDIYYEDTAGTLWVLSEPKHDRVFGQIRISD